MNKPSKLTAVPGSASPLDTAIAERDRRARLLQTEEAKFGPVAEHGFSPRNRHLQRRYALREALVHQADQVVKRLQQAARLDEAKRAAQAEFDQANAAIAPLEAEVRRETAALADIKARVAALADQIIAMEANRFPGLSEAQAALSASTAAGDQAGATAAAQQVAAIKVAGSAVQERTFPLRLQIEEIEKLVAPATARVERARQLISAAESDAARARVEVLAIARDQAAIAFRDAHAAFLAGDTRPTRQRRNLTVDFTIGASARVLELLGTPNHEPVTVSPIWMQLLVQELKASEDTPELAVDPMTLKTAEDVRRCSEAEEAAAVQSPAGPPFFETSRYAAA